jgi:predicted RNA-binding protein (virulence factor B family)
MSRSKEQQTKTDVSETLVEWVKTYFEENKEALNLLDINSPEDLKRRILNIDKLSKQ